MPSGAKMILILNEPHKIGCSSFNSTTTSNHAPQVEILYTEQPMEIVDDQLPTRSTVEVKDNSQVSTGSATIEYLYTQIVPLIIRLIKFVRGHRICLFLSRAMGP
jgi:hypothetical protein